MWERRESRRALRFLLRSAMRLMKETIKVSRPAAKHIIITIFRVLIFASRAEQISFFIKKFSYKRKNLYSVDSILLNSYYVNKKVRIL